MSVDKLESLTGGSGVHVFLVLWKAARAVEAYAQKSVSELEMCGSDFAVLEALLHKGPLPVNEIGRKVLLTSGSITVAVDRLETKGLVERRASSTDRRTRIVHLTKDGRSLITRAYAEHAAELERLASASLTKAERVTLIRLLKKIGYEAAAETEQDEQSVSSSAAWDSSSVFCRAFLQPQSFSSCSAPLGWFTASSASS